MVAEPIRVETTCQKFERGACGTTVTPWWTGVPVLRSDLNTAPPRRAHCLALDRHALERHCSNLACSAARAACVWGRSLPTALSAGAQLVNSGQASFTPAPGCVPPARECSRNSCRTSAEHKGEPRGQWGALLTHRCSCARHTSAAGPCARRPSSCRRWATQLALSFSFRCCGCYVDGHGALWDRPPGRLWTHLKSPSQSPAGRIVDHGSRLGVASTPWSCSRAYHTRMQPPAWRSLAWTWLAAVSRCPPGRAPTRALARAPATGQV